MNAVAVHQFESQDSDVCFDLLGRETIGRVAYAAAQDLMVVPVNYRLTGATILLNGAPCSSLDQLADHGAAITFEVDQYEERLPRAWSVVMTGTLRPLGERGRARLLEVDPPLVAWPAASDAGCFEFHPKRFSARVIHR